MQLNASDCGPIWPSSVSCNGRGLCLNGSCLCDPGWSSNSEFSDFNGIDCVTNVRTRVALAVVLLILALADSFCTVADIYF
jgi:hypothetical protein